MTSSLLIYTSLLILTLLVYSFLIYWLASRGEGEPYRWFITTQIFIFFWSIVAIANVYVPFSLQPYLIQVKYVFAWLLGPCWMMFALYYTGRAKIARKIKIPLFGLFGVFILLALTNNFHHIIWSDTVVSDELFPHVYLENTIVHLVGSTLDYIALFVGFSLLIEYGIKAGRINKGQLFLLSFSPLPSWVLSMVRKYKLYDIPAPHLDYGLIATTIFAVCVVYALFRQGFFTYVPFARDVILREISKPILIVDNKGRIADYNEEFLSLYPEVKGEFGKQIEQLVPEMIEQSDVSIKLPQKGELVYNISKSEILVDDKMSGEAIILDDVTEIREKTEQLEQQTEQLNEFVSVVSHDLRNPLSVAKGYAEMVQDTGETENIGEVISSLDRANRLIEDSLQLARKGRAIEEKEQVELYDLIIESWNTSDVKDAELEIKFENDVLIMADGERLRTLFENLFRNSVDHGPDDVTIRVGLCNDMESFYIEDTGPGIPENEREKVLEFGYTTSEEGTGIGLSTVNKIAEAHGWTMEIGESKEKGARFEFHDIVAFKDAEQEESTHL